jgi:hypothetical protein
VSHPSVADQAPRPPADAYHRAASLLPDRYFVEPPPLSGTVVSVRGRDQVWTEWAMTDDLAADLVAGLRPHRELTVRANPFDMRNRRAA